MVFRNHQRTYLVVAGVMSAIAFTATAALAQSRELWMYNGDATAVEGYFNAGESIYATCDADCTDLDITLYDSRGNVVAQDLLPDANPIVVAPSAGNYQVLLSMPSCTTDAGCAVWVDSDQGF
ncbi:hypothetical protein H6G89_33465 [Oscillatoria sp. FACHB-1407]|uniref:hypothetical protein n=1 Tax=Oscillatoria sp. FACHB-1407 TaxID=2692847 RepID=UPI00168740CA|nr:hypothetical protein [Oscillatoria sp. FACHB-1407]MBD2465898.1 hypothetical protein [Oscillatoria sp. FACHB-1407]